MFTYFEHPAKLVSHIGASKRCIETYGPMNAEIGVECGGENRNLLGDFAYGAKCSRKVRRDRNRDQEDSKKKLGRQNYIGRHRRQVQGILRLLLDRHYTESPVCKMNVAVFSSSSPLP